MPKSKKFTIGELNLRDCWKIIKVSLGYLIALGLIYGISYFLFSGYEASSKGIFGFEPASHFWMNFPNWVRFSLIVIVFLLILKGLTSNLLSEVGKRLIDLGAWLEKTSLKYRILLVIGLTFCYLLLRYTDWVGVVLIMVTASIIASYMDLKREKNDRWKKMKIE